MSLPVIPDDMPPARGFSHGMVSDGGKTLHIAGETGHYADLTLDTDFVGQFGQACRNVAAVVTAAGGEPTNVVSLTIFVTDVAAYRDNIDAIGPVYQAVFGKHFPAMALIGITELVDPRALVEITGVAILPA